jgi:prepilin-type N-terminal cleavage/methylation domain-containing protein
MKQKQNKLNSNKGFTLAEVVITIAIASIFVISIAQIYTVQTRISSISAGYNAADLLAYNNLRTYAYGKAPTWFQCTYSGSTPQPMNLINSTGDVSGIPSPVIQSVVATAPYGCGGSSSGIGYPIRVTSTVTYGKDARKVVHATYSTY